MSHNFIFAAICFATKQFTILTKTAEGTRIIVTLSVNSSTKSSAVRSSAAMSKTFILTSVFGKYLQNAEQVYDLQLF